VHVVELLDSLLFAPNIEIVESALPKAPPSRCCERLATVAFDWDYSFSFFAAPANASSLSRAEGADDNNYT
jgi:hypothetical protein